MATLQPEWETKLKLECLTRRAYSVLHFLGASLDIDDVAKIVKDDPERDVKPTQLALRTGVVAKEKDVQSVINWLNANKLVNQTAYLSNKFKQEIFGEKDLITLNSLIGERVVNTASLGGYRETSSLEYPEIKSPPSVEVKYQRAFCLGGVVYQSPAEQGCAAAAAPVCGAHSRRRRYRQKQQYALCPHAHDGL